VKILKLILALGLVLLAVAGWIAWRNDKAPADIHQAAGSVKGAVDGELLRNAERLAETLRRCKTTVNTNKDIK